MPLDTCITNVGEYYSSHYLDSTFAKDVKALVSKWSEEGSQSSPRRLQNLSQYYFRAKTQTLDEEQPIRRQFVGDEIRGWHAHLLQALGYNDLTPYDHPVEGGDTFVPTLGRVNRYNKPWLVVCETHFCLPDGSLKEGMPSEDPLGMEPYKDQLKEQADHKLCEGDWTRCVGRVLTEEDAPRWILLLAGSQVLLLDRNTFAQGRFLAFDLDDAFGRKEKDTFNHVAAFLAAETLCPGGESDEVLLDKLEEQSHRFAHGVTENLQFAVREAIELLVNEWVADRRAKGWSYSHLRAEEADIGMAHGFPQNDDGSYEITADQLKREALAFVYRLLFCFYAEARGGELEILPIDEDTYRLGYSLESIRDLEQVPLTAATEDGTYFHSHLRKLFGLIHDGFHPHDTTDRQQRLGFHSDIIRTFTIRPLTATLFSPDSTPLLNRARLSNRCLQAIIRRLSLSTDDKSRTIGRVNYAELGINQLGAVYEGLLSYQGMFADQDLIHVKPAGKEIRDKKTPTWFVPKDRLEEFKKDEVERLPDGKSRVFTKGTFILHLNGIDREQSASYYTPEVLTRCLVEEALRELLKDYGPDDADKILDLKVCEPAMGSGAFLNEAAEQLAQRYLELKQKQIDETIEPARYGDELRRVKHYITTRNVYGVDLNPTAVELGALSLWLGSIHRLLQKKGENGGRDEFVCGATPWFGLRLRCGNSLIGARRAVWTAEQLKKGKHSGKDSDTPRLLKPSEKRGENEIYHFLVFDEDMVPTHTDTLMKSFWPEHCAAAKKWIVQQAKPRWKSEEVKEALEICDLIDKHWEEYAKQRSIALDRTACTATVWPTPPDSDAATQSGPTLEYQENSREELESSSGDFQRLKLVMDTWCSLYFWPLERACDLPKREAFLASARLLLGDKPPNASWRPLLSARLGFEIDALLAAAEGRIPNTAMLADVVPWFDGAVDLTAELHFHHWELAFVEMLGPFAQSAGFDLIIGNPPWVRVAWSHVTVISELDPIIGVRDFTISAAVARRDTLLTSGDARVFYATQQGQLDGTVSFLNSRHLYATLAGMKANLYKNFLVQTWGLLAQRGIVGLLHPEGTYDDVNGGTLRTAIYPRLRAHYQFKNQFKLFPDIGNEAEFSINIYGHIRNDVCFHHMSNLFMPNTIAASHAHQNAADPIPGIKTRDNAWNTLPHRHRIVTISFGELSLFANALEEAHVPPLEARLPQAHAQEVLSVVGKLVQCAKRLADFEGEYTASYMFDESKSQHEAIITRHDFPSFQPKSPTEWVVSGPHFYVATPINKTAHTKCQTHRAYDEIDLTTIPDDFLPRAPYRPGDKADNRQTFLSKIPTRPGSGRKLTESYRYVNRRRISMNTERSLLSAIIPQGAVHIHPVLSITFSDSRQLLLLAGVTSSLVADFLVRFGGKDDVYATDLARMPWISERFADPIIHRTMRLNCVTDAYVALWEKHASNAIGNESWTSQSPLLANVHEIPWHKVDSNIWHRGVGLRTDFSRRQALLEIDVLVAMALGLTLNELITVYQVQFPVLRWYDFCDRYDAQGRRVPAPKGLRNARKIQGAKDFHIAEAEWQALGNSPHDSNSSPLTVSWTVDDGNAVVDRTYHPPFIRVDREADYARAWDVFEQRYGGQK